MLLRAVWNLASARNLRPVAVVLGLLAVTLLAGWVTGAVGRRILRQLT